jgi:hypothetical protein
MGSPKVLSSFPVHQKVGGYGPLALDRLLLCQPFAASRSPLLNTMMSAGHENVVLHWPWAIDLRSTLIHTIRLDVADSESVDTSWWRQASLPAFCRALCFAAHPPKSMVWIQSMQVAGSFKLPFVSAVKHIPSCCSRLIFSALVWAAFSPFCLPIKVLLQWVSDWWSIGEAQRVYECCEDLFSGTDIASDESSSNDSRRLHNLSHWSMNWKKKSVQHA